MTQRRHHRDPVIWIIFAVAVSVPSIELTRLLRQRDATRSAPEAPRVEVAGQPRSNSTPPAPTTSAAQLPAERVDGPVEVVDSTPKTPRIAVTADSLRAAPLDSSRFLPIAPTATPIVTSTILPNGEVAVVLEESGTVTVWNVMAHKQLAKFESGISLPKDTLAIAPQMALVRPREMAQEQTLLAIGSRKAGMRVWNALTGQPLLSLTQPAIDIAWTGLAELTTLGRDGRMQLWDVMQPANSALTATPPSPGGKVKDVDFSFENEATAVASLAGVHVLPRFGRWIPIQTSNDAHPQSVVFSADGEYLASAWSNGQVRLYATTAVNLRDESGNLLLNKTIEPKVLGWVAIPEPGRRLLAFSRDGKWLAMSASSSKVISLFSTRQNVLPLSIEVPRGPLRSMWFAPDGRTVVVGIAGERFLRGLPMPAERTR